MFKKLDIAGLQEKILNTFSTTLDKNKSTVISFLKNSLGPASVTALQQDEIILIIAKHIYGIAPLPARLAIREETFVNFLMQNKESVIEKLEPLVSSVKTIEEQAQSEDELILLNYKDDEQANNKPKKDVSTRPLNIEL